MTFLITADDEHWRLKYLISFLKEIITVFQRNFLLKYSKLKKLAYEKVPPYNDRLFLAPTNSTFFSRISDFFKFFAHDDRTSSFICSENREKIMSAWKNAMGHVGVKSLLWYRHKRAFTSSWVSYSNCFQKSLNLSSVKDISAKRLTFFEPYCTFSGDKLSDQNIKSKIKFQRLKRMLCMLYYFEW